MNKLEAEILTIYNTNGLFGTFSYIMSSEQAFLFPRNLIDPALNKAKELALLGKGERTLIWFINDFDEAKNRSIVEGGELLYNCTIERKISLPQIKSLKFKVKKLSTKEKAFYASFKGVFELDRGDIQNKSVGVKLSKIYSLYTAVIPACFDYDSIIIKLSNNGFIISKQDLFAFISLVLERKKGKYFSIPRDLWGAFFGNRNILPAKLAFKKLGFITVAKKALPGFMSASYKLSLPQGYEFDLTKVKISCIRTLEKINRIKQYRSIFSLKDKVKALRILTNLHVSSFKSSEIGAKLNGTNLFLRDGIFRGLIEDLETIEKIISGSEYVTDAHYLASNLLVFLKTANSGNFTRYGQFNRSQKVEKNSGGKVSEPMYDFDGDCEKLEPILDDI
jgi:hypothetical protein